MNIFKAILKYLPAVISVIILIFLILNFSITGRTISVLFSLLLLIYSLQTLFKAIENKNKKVRFALFLVLSFIALAGAIILLII